MIFTFFFVFTVVFIFCIIIRFAASETGGKFLNRLEEKRWRQEMQKEDPLFEAAYQARQKSIKNSKKNPEYQAAYNEYLANLKRGQIPLSFDEFINQIIDSLAGVGNFKINIDLYGNIESIELEGYGEVPLEMIKELEPRAYAKIMEEYEKFRREHNFKD